MAEVFSITEDKKGFIWMSNYYGLMKYDGTSVRIFSNSPIDTQSITFGGLNYLKNSRDNGIWVGSLNGGVSFFDLNTETAVNYLNDPDDPASLSSNQVTVPFEDPDGRLWVGASDFTLNLLDRAKGTFRRYRPALPPGIALSASEPGTLGEIIQDPLDPDLLWLGSKTGLFSFRKSTGSFTYFPYPQQRVFETWYRDYPIELLVTPDRKIWIGSYNTGLLQFNPSDHSWHSWRNQNSAFEDAIANSIIEIIDAGDNLLLITVRTGEIWWFDRKTGALEVENLQPGVKGLAPAIYSALKRPDGDIWLGRGTDIVILTQKPPAIPTVSLPRKNPNLTSNNWMRASLLSPDNTRLYLGTLHGDGLLIWDLEKDEFSAVRYNPDRNVQDIFMDDLFMDQTGRIWIGSAAGLLFWDPGAERIKPATLLYPALKRLSNAHLTAVCIAAGRIWMGTEHNGLFTLSLERAELEVVQEPFLREVTVNKIAEGPDGRIWIGCNRGLSFFDPASSRYTCFGKSPRKKAGLSNAQVNDFEWDEKGGMWIATLGGGINFLPPVPAKDEPIFQYFMNDGTPGCNNIYQIQIHPNGQIWLGNDSGLSMLDPQTGIFINYDKRDGLFAKIGSLQVLPDGDILSGGNMGFHLFNPDSLLRSESVPVPYIKNFKVFDRNFQLKDTLMLAPGQNHFSLELGALNFNLNARNTYMYRLKGHDPDWVFSGDRNYVAYTNLKPGPYRFELKAANRHNAWSDKVAGVDIYIRPHFWEADWFRMLVAIGLALVGWGFSTYSRFKRREKQAQQLIDYYANSSYNFSTEDDILWDLASNYISRLHFEDCVVYLLDENRQVLVQKAAFGPKNPKANEIYQPIEIPVGVGIVGSVAVSGEGVIVQDIRKDPRYIPDQFAGRSEIAVPIIQDEKVIGIIDAEHSEAGFFKPYHFQLLSTLAALCANKLAAARAGVAIAEKETQLLELDKHLAETQLIALRAQMNPHFLFNCLNSINWYIVKNKPREASRYLTKFSRLIRLILDHSKARQITLEKELEALKLYIEIEAMRFDEKFEFQLEVDDQLDPEEINIPPLIFQPYVENAIWHGLMQAPYPGRLLIRLRPNGRFLECIIEDNGIGRQAARTLQQQSLATKTSQGMSITAKRILLHQQQAGSETPVEIIDLYDETGHPAGTSVRLNLPI